MIPITKEQIIETIARISPHIHKTTIATSRILDEMAKATLFFKCENFQRTGSFKIRGATNAILSLTANEKAKGVVTHSSGNFAQALAMAATSQGIKSWIVMPENAPNTKKDAVKQYGGEVILCAPTLVARETTAEKYVEKHGATFIHPFNQLEVIQGQSTAAMELINEVQNLDYIVAPVGGGGLLSGTALAAHYFSPSTKIIGAEPLGADDAYKSFKQGVLIPQNNPQTIADGLRTSLGTLTFPIIQVLVSEIKTVTEEQIIDALQLFWTRTKIVIEPSAAVALAVVLNTPETFVGKRIGIILSGGNIDLKHVSF
ncbi:MAG: pyridoxal-phosphate dependent enzyme [Salinivirgaceae bacterium]|nr:pyridoxal-phosphate dependent enzyme [Salinivirgaceae bacterium]